MFHAYGMQQSQKNKNKCLNFPQAIETIQIPLMKDFSHNTLFPSLYAQQFYVPLCEIPT